MDFERLQEFIRIAECGSITKAALEMGVSAATLGARMHQFEKAIGHPLFCRSGHTVSLTDTGEKLLPNAKELIRSYSYLLRSMQTATAYSYRQLRICLTEIVLPLHLGPFLDQLNAENPSIRLDLLDASNYTLNGSLMSGEADLYFATMMEQPVSSGIVRQTISGPSPYVLLPRSNPLSERGTLTLKDLDGECFILYPRTAESFARNFQLTNLNAARIRYNTYDSDTSYNYTVLLVSIGKGILISPTPFINPPPGTISIPLLGLLHPASTYLYYQRAAANPDVAIFIQDFSRFTQEIAQVRKNV